MKFSYALNYGDALLWKVFNNLKAGYYIDVGVSDPEYNSFTKLFYDAGWSGINLIPLSHQHSKFCRERANDININNMVSTDCEDCSFYEIVPNNSFSGLLKLASVNKDLIENYSNQYHLEYNSHQIKTISLNEVLKKHNPLDREINFLKIEASGAEETVLNSIDLSYYRPNIIIITGTNELFSTQITLNWEKLLHSADYQLVYFDGLSRYFICNEKTYLATRFNYPAHFDGYIRYSDYQVAKQIEQLQKEIQKITQERDAFHQEIFESDRHISVLSIQNKNSLHERSLEKLMAATEKENLLSSMKELEKERNFLAKEHRRMKESLITLENKVQHFKLLKTKFLNQKIQVENSLSWKITKPLRQFRKLLAFKGQAHV